MKNQCDKKRVECEFRVREWVYLKLQLYRQQSVKNKSCQKLAPKFGPFMIKSKMGKVSYELQLPDQFRIHLVFHVSQLKKHIGDVEFQTELSIIGATEQSQKCLWSSFPEYATWKVLHHLKLQFPNFDP
ncbi:hypothetical protein HRI_000659300 [Hibiscus trionum]|uniref:Tf2-1-like SH3-like domain-containing protein n=1 Tax=Hibiscus trionum TaxID=183268 RepID=A0A9W7H2L2_HIBTR|nr:hypothetical protein HRI_000659300 [Hibiscus trionum]